MKAKDAQQVAASNKESFKESLEVSFAVNYQAKFTFTGRIDIFEYYEYMKSFHQTFRECFSFNCKAYGQALIWLQTRLQHVNFSS